MKLFILSLIFSSAAQAQVTEIDRVIYDQTHRVILDLNAQTVRCLIGDYGVRSLKISVPQLRFFTVFKHTTRGETEPCINAGPCKNDFFEPPQSRAFGPEDILDQNKPQEEALLRVLRVERLIMDPHDKYCSRYLVETVTSKVRGLDFSHTESAEIGITDFETCEKLAAK